MTEKKQINFWDDEKRCNELQERWGDYDQYSKFKGVVIKDGEIKEKNTKAFIFNVLDEIINKKSTLCEIGVGTGHILWYFKNKVLKLYGIDYSSIMLNLAKKQFVDYDVEFKEGNCWDIPFPNNFIDILYQVDVCMHIGGSWDSIKEMIRVAKKYVVFTGPSFDDFDNKMDNQIKGISWAVSVPNLEINLNRLIEWGEIKSYEWKERKPTKVYKHRILVIEK